MYQDGKNITEISNALHADRNRIKNVLIDSGVYVPPTIKDKQTKFFILSGILRYDFVSKPFSVNTALV